jgi:diamine N-acetyltransferase
MQRRMIAGDKIFLRIPEKGDEKKILTWENFPDNDMVNYHHEKVELQDIIKWISEKHHDFLLEKELRLMICDNTTRDVVGSIDLFQLNKETKACGTGIIVDRNHRKKGFASEAIHLLVNFSFNHFGLKKIWCQIHPKNEISIQLFKKCGFQHKKTNEDNLLIFERTKTE